MTIYLDIVFLENVLMNYIIIWVCGCVLKEDIRFWRILLSSSVRSNIYNSYVFGNIKDIL